MRVGKVMVVIMGVVSGAVREGGVVVGWWY